MKIVLLCAILALGYCSVQKRAQHNHPKALKGHNNRHIDSENQELLREGLKYLQPLVPKLLKYARNDQRANIFSKNDNSIEKAQRQKLMKEADKLLQPLRKRLDDAYRKSGRKVGQSRGALEVPGKLFDELLTLSKCVSKLWLPSIIKCMLDVPKQTTASPSEPTQTSTSPSETTTEDTATLGSDIAINDGPLTPAPGTNLNELEPFAIEPPPKLSKTEYENIPNKLIHVSPEDLRKSRKKKRHGRARGH